jgi:hypothetical protein
VERYVVQMCATRLVVSRHPTCGCKPERLINSCPLFYQPYCWVCFEVLDRHNDHAHGSQVHGGVYLWPEGNLRPEYVAATHRKWREDQAHELGRSLGLTAEEVDELVRRGTQETKRQGPGSGDADEVSNLHTDE